MRSGVHTGKYSTLLTWTGRWLQNMMIWGAPGTLRVWLICVVGLCSSCVVCASGQRANRAATRRHRMVASALLRSLWSRTGGLESAHECVQCAAAGAHGCARVRRCSCIYAGIYGSLHSLSPSSSLLLLYFTIFPPAPVKSRGFNETVSLSIKY